jgi:23S rRNA C2498 (ribose-2'-O)-methylase RlmM
MKLLPEIEFHEDIRLLIYKPRGLIDEAAINEVIGVIEDLEAKLQEPFNRFSDTLAADEVELNFKYIIQASLHRRLAYAGRAPVKSAVLATDSTMIHYARLHALLTQGSPIYVRVFQDRNEAAQWLGIPIERLAIPTANDKTS